ncbi:MAG TPA: hypothetical protein VID19_10355 [Candidatus Eremiobacteraceae bacterium]
MWKILNVFTGLRSKALHVTPRELGFVPVAGAPQVFGVVTDWSLDNGVATITAFVTGDASLYLSSGGGVIGGIEHENVRLAAKSVIDIAATCLELLKPTTGFPLPAAGCTRFSVLSIGINHCAECATIDLTERKHALSPLFFAVQELIGQLRLTK